MVASGPIASNLWSAGTGLIHELHREDRANNHRQFFDQGMINVPPNLILP